MCSIFPPRATANRHSVWNSSIRSFAALLIARGHGAATATFLPYIIANTNQDFSIEGRPWSSAAEARSANTEIISPNYFRLMESL